MDDQDRQQLRKAYALVIAARNMIEAVWGSETDRLEYAKSQGLDDAEASIDVAELENNIADLETVIGSLEILAPIDEGEGHGD